MRRLSTKAKKSKAERSSSESTITEEEKVAAGNDNDASGNESASDDKPSGKKKAKRGKKNDSSAASQKTSEDGVAEEGNDKRKRRSTAAKTEESEEEGPAADEEYEVESVVDSRVVRGKTQYKIRWKGFNADNDTWEPEEDLSCPDLIGEFLKSQSEGTGKSAKSAKNKKRGSKASSAEPKNKKKKDSEDEEEAEKEEGGEEKVYEVEKVVEVHFKKNGKREFLIRWKGFSSNDDTWEPEENLSCPELIEKFMSKVEKVKNLNVRELRMNPQHTDRFTLSTQSNARRLSRRHPERNRTKYHDAE